ncbi:TolC family protein [Catenovulum sp. 2E275]|uniref:TolC family protein n=1 Tax=Catenovulum sp. 2E275 TaxID=2980497 RepID=UPI0021CFF021|nr:TolC family protein [Catenovulum sp. 2E275]MCU4676242.1 TolC family protein [Catenovulum sp. 2E275]
MPSNWLETTEKQTDSELHLLTNFPKELNHLIQLALVQNQNLEIAFQRIQIAQADYQIQYGNTLPDVTATSGYDWNERRNNGGTVNQTTVNTRLRVSWELDIWNRLAQLNDAAIAT